MALGVLLGLIVGVLWAIVAGNVDSRIRTSEDAQELVDAPLLAAIPEERIRGGNPVALDSVDYSARAEAYRLLRTSLHFVDATRTRRTTVVTSAVPGEGKSVTAVNLAVAVGDGGRNVLLIDADLRRPTVAKYLGLENAVGLTNILAGDAALHDVLATRTSPAGQSISVLTSGPVPPNPSELLSSPQFDTLLESLEQEFDTILIDAPPVNVVADASVLAGKAGGALLVIDAGRVKRPDIQRAVSQLETVDAKIVGIVLNRMKFSDRRANYYYYRPHQPTHSSSVHAGDTALNP